MAYVDPGGRGRSERKGAACINAARIVTADPDDCMARVRAIGMDMRHNQLSGGPYSAVIDALRLPGLQVILTAYGPSITAQGSMPGATYGLGLPVPGTGTLHVNHRLLQPHEIGAMRPDGELHLCRAPGLQLMGVLADAARIDRMSEAMYGRPLSRLIGAGHVLRSTADAVAAGAERLSHLLAQGIAGASAARSRPRDSVRVAHALESAIFDAFLGVVHDPEPLRGWSARERIVRRARDLIESDHHDMTTVADLCMNLGVPVRTLDDAFRSCLGVAPRHFMAAMRLNKVRRNLRHAREDTTVTEVATRFGFYHFGRFSADYRRLFGELPSATLQRVRC